MKNEMTNNQHVRDAAAIARHIAIHTQINGGGTFDRATGEPAELTNPNGWYAVSLDGGTSVVLSEGDVTNLDNLTELIADAIEGLDKTHPDVTLVGTWISPTGVLYVDATVLVLGLEKAIGVAQNEAQLAFYGFGEREVITTPLWPR